MVTRADGVSCCFFGRTHYCHHPHEWQIRNVRYQYNVKQGGTRELSSLPWPLATTPRSLALARVGGHGRAVSSRRPNQATMHGRGNHPGPAPSACTARSLLRLPWTTKSWCPRRLGISRSTAACLRARRSIHSPWRPPRAVRRIPSPSPPSRC